MLVGQGIRVSKENRRVRLPGIVGGCPIEIAFAVRGEAKALSQALGAQIQGIFLALKVEWKEGFDPFRWVLGLHRIFGVRRRAANFNLLGKDGLVILVEGDETLWKERGDSLLDFRWIGMDKSASEGIPRRLDLLGSETIAQLMDKPAGRNNGDKNHECRNERAECLNKERLHQVMILEEGGVSSGW